MIVRGRLVDTVKKDFSGHTVLILVTEKVDLAEGDKASDFWKPAEIRSPVDENGLFSVELPEKELLKDPIVVRVLAPDGEIRTEKTYSVRGLGGEAWSINVSPKSYFAVDRNPDPFLGRRAKLVGRVLDASGRHDVADRQIVFLARAEGAGPNDFAPVFACHTDGHGYFSGEYPKGKFVEAHALVSGVGPKTPLRLEAGGFPRRVVFAVEKVSEEESVGEKRGLTAECQCEETQIPRAPDSEDLTGSPATYSEDLRGGRCVDLTVPNRALEEFDFYSVIRTTDPQIQGLTLDNRPPAPVPPIVIDLLGRSLVPEPVPAGSEGSSGVTGVRVPADIGLANVHLVTSALNLRAVSLSANVAPTNPRIASRLGSIGDGLARPSAVIREDSGGKLMEGAVIGRSTSSGAPLVLDSQLVKSIATNPDGFTPQTLLTAERSSALRQLNVFIDVLRKNYPGRADLNTQNPVDWDETPTFYQATTIAHGHLLHFKQVWRADGYSLGDLLYSLPLAPNQEKQIAILDWDRREMASRTEALTEEESLRAVLSRDRDISEIARSSLQEHTEGGSEAQTGGFFGGIGAAFGPVLLGIAGGSASASSNAWQDSSRQFSANMLNQLRDRTMQSASSVRSQRATVIQTVRQGETARAQTEVAANRNHCHAVTTEYFEVLRHFQVTQELVDVQECLFIPLPFSMFDRPKALRWREILASRIRNRGLRGGFDAIERILNAYEGSDLPLGRYSQENLEYLEGSLMLTFQLARPRDPDDKFEPLEWTWAGHLLGWMSPQEFYNTYLRNQAQKDRVFQEQLAPQIVESFVQRLRFYAVDLQGNERPLPIDATLTSTYRPNAALFVTLRLGGTLPSIRREDSQYSKISAKARIGSVERWLSEILPTNSKVIVNSGTMRYRTKHLDHRLFNDVRILNDLTGTDDVRIDTPLDREELRNPREEDKEIAKQLVSHLNEHIEYYHKAIWWDVDRDRRYMLLDGFLAPNANGRSVASVVENRLIGLVGNSLVMPVARSFHLDPTYRQDVKMPLDLLHLYAPNTPVPAMRISVPTRGVFAESVMGSCNACEFKDESRFWRYEEATSGVGPTPILPVSTESRRAEPGDLKPTPFPTPMVNIQTPAAAPDPTGLGSLFQLMGTSGIFRDITGLTENQRNALAALNTAAETAKFFGGEAAKLEQARMNQAGIEKTLQTVQKAERSGLITTDDARTFARDAIKGTIVPVKPDESPLTDVPQVQGLLESAKAADRSEVMIDRATGTETLRVSRGASLGEIVPLTKHYSLKPGVVLTEKVESKIAEIANEFFKASKKDLVVTSGSRTAAEKAAAMYTKLSLGDDLSEYVNKPARDEIKKAYDDGKSAGKTESEIQKDMTKVIQGQMDVGVYISNHLLEGAVDVRIKDLTADEKKALKEAIKKGLGKDPLPESTPPHFHLEIS